MLSEQVGVVKKPGPTMCASCAQLQLVITAKLRRSESFAFTWREDQSVGGWGARSCRCTPAVPSSSRTTGAVNHRSTRHGSTTAP